MSSANILFYSNNCEGSKYLISLMQGENLIRFFHMVCTDNNPKIPPQIIKTPTLIIRNVPTPYVAGDAFAWFSKVKQWKINMMMQKMTQAQQKYLQSINNNLVVNNSNILGFSQAEMQGMSDMFGYFNLEEDKWQDNGMPHAYFTCDNMGKESIFTPPRENKISETQQKIMYNNLETERKKQDEMIKQSIDSFRQQYSKN